MADALPLVAYPDLESRVKAVEEDGFVYFPGVLNAEEIAELRDAMDRLTQIPESFDRYNTPENGGFLNKHINNAFNRDVVFLQYLDKPEIIELGEAIHGEDCHVIGMTAWTTGPGRPDQTLHTDWLPISLPADVLADPRVKVPIFITTAHFYLDDLYEELGPTKFIPGSHRAGRSPKAMLSIRGLGITVSCVMRAMWLFSAARCGTVVRRIRASRTGIYCRCITRSG